MIRGATFSDLPAIHALVVEMHGASEFAERGIALNPALVRSFLVGAVQRAGGEVAGSTMLAVVDRGQGVEGFMLGLLQPVYAVCHGLEAQDFWLYCAPNAPKSAASRLLDAYVEWAESIPSVRDIMLSWTNVVKVDGAKIARLYERKGFVKRGEMFVKGSAK